METREQNPQSNEWFSITFKRGLSEDVDAWMVEIPSLGKLYVNLEDRPNLNERVDDKKAYVLNPEIEGLSANVQTLLAFGFKTLSLALTPPSYSKYSQIAELGVKNSDVRYTSLFHNEEAERPMKPWAWFKSNDPNPYTPRRNIMIRPDKDQLDSIQIRFLGGGDN